MSTYILVLANDTPLTRWLARKWGTDPVALTVQCTYDPATNRFFDKDPRDQILPCRCATLEDPMGNKPAVIMVKLP
jgi:hypothetical protein